jgi:sortase A
MNLDSLQSDIMMRHTGSGCGVCRSLAAGWRGFIHRSNGPRWLHIFKLACFAIGVLALGYCGMVLVDAAVTQTHARRVLSDLQARFASAPAKIPAAAPAPGSVLASLDSPRIGLSVMVLEGTDKRTLRVGAGHLPGSGLPGGDSNVVIAGHRDTFFRPLRDVKVGDVLDLTSPEGSHRYQVIWSRVVPPNDTQELYPTSDAVLTLVTCYPFSYVGPAPNRLLIRAKRVDSSAP